MKRLSEMSSVAPSPAAMPPPYCEALFSVNSLPMMEALQGAVQRGAACGRASGQAGR